MNSLKKVERQRGKMLAKCGADGYNEDGRERGAALRFEVFRETDRSSCGGFLSKQHHGT